MKRITVSIAFLAIVLATLILWLDQGGNAWAGSTKSIQILYGHFDPPQSVWAPAMNKWADELKQRTNGQVEVVFQWAMARTGELYDMTKQNIIDMGFLVPGYHPGAFPYSEIISLPFVVDSAEVGSRAMTRFAQKGYLDKEYSDVKPIHIGTASGDILFTKSKPVTVLADLKGLKIFAANPELQRRLTIMGATPVQISYPELYTAMQKGIIDGYMMGWPLMEMFNLFEVTRYASPPGIGTGTWVVAMNSAKWNSLPDDVQKVIEELSGKYAAEYGHAWDAASDRGKKLFLDKGGQILNWQPGELEKMSRLYSPMWNEWIDSMKKKGLSGKQAVDDLCAILMDLGVNQPAVGYLSK